MFEKLLQIVQLYDIPTKSVGSIFVREFDRDNIPVVKGIIKEISEFEHGYIGEHTIRVFDENELMEYHGKFELNDHQLTELRNKCRKFDIEILPLFSYENELITVKDFAYRTYGKFILEEKDTLTYTIDKPLYRLKIHKYDDCYRLFGDTTEGLEVSDFNFLLPDGEFTIVDVTNSENKSVIKIKRK